VLISPTFNQQLLCSKITKAEKDRRLDCIFALWGSACVKAERKMLIKLTSVRLNRSKMSQLKLPDEKAARNNHLQTTDQVSLS